MSISILAEVVGRIPKPIVDISWVTPGFSIEAMLLLLSYFAGCVLLQLILFKVNIAVMVWAKRCIV